MLVSGIGRWLAILWALYQRYNSNPQRKVHGANMGPIWGRQDPGGPHVGPMNIVILVYITISFPDEGTYVMYD